jgi:hypothetical protein
VNKFSYLSSDKPTAVFPFFEEWFLDVMENENSSKYIMSYISQRFIGYREVIVDRKHFLALMETINESL